MDPDRIKKQIEMFKRGVPFQRLIRACTIGDGILEIGAAEQRPLLDFFKEANDAGRFSKMVPASGAASRMFKLLHQAMDRLTSGEPETDPEFLRFCNEFEHFAFAEEVKQNLNSAHGPLSPQQFLPILRRLLNPEGMNYSNKPKGLLSFHRYEDHVRTPLEEHFREAEAYATSRSGRARLHFTVSPEHRTAFKALEEKVRGRYEHEGFRLEVTYSVQKSTTDTIAVDPENRPFRGPDGNLVFRAAGHGALIENLNDLQADLVFIKNIDNVVPDRLKQATILYKKLLGGFLVKLQNRLFAYLKWLDHHELTEEKSREITDFMTGFLGIRPRTEGRSPVADKARLRALLNRPLRVCGMVKNQGEPGGGPFWVGNSEGEETLQIVETSQIQLDDPAQAAILKNATHFNPVDLVCGVRDYRGQPFPLRRFVDEDACFISSKSMAGKPLKALELPGLWNGAMARWNTAFVQVPLSTFNPVKTVNDLLRPEHRQNA